VSSDAPAITFPTRATHPLRSIARRLGIAALATLFIAVLAYAGRAGYRDADGTPLTMLDAIYYATVTLTTTGYGDITPISPSARAITAFIVTPVRIIFLIVLIGTTLELLTERYREARAANRWRRNVNEHTIVIGYGTTGRGAIDALMATGTARTDIVIIDQSAAVSAEARAAGHTTVTGDGTRTPVLAEAEVARAKAVVVSAGSDDTATLVTLTARELNPTATIVAAVNETENAHLLVQSGATAVITSAEAAGHLLGLATVQPEAVAVVRDLIDSTTGLELSQRAVGSGEIGGPPRIRAGELPVVVVRNGVRLSLADPAATELRADDVVVVLRVR
jgi:voltage-gated potassium channel